MSVLESFKRGEEIQIPFVGRVAVCDWTVSLPKFMKQADTLIVDPPRNSEGYRSFYHRVGVRMDADPDFSILSDALFARIAEINPVSMFIGIGNRMKPDYLERAAAQFRHVTSYVTYYHPGGAVEHLVYATNESVLVPYSNLEEGLRSHTIKWLCANHPARCIGDLCMGYGDVGKAAIKAGRRFVGVDINARRISNFVAAVSKPDVKTICKRIPRLEHDISMETLAGLL